MVTTPAGEAGLAVEAGTHLLVGEAGEELVSHTLARLSDPTAAVRLTGAAWEYVRRQHTPAVTRPIARTFLGAAATRAGDHSSGQDG